MDKNTKTRNFSLKTKKLFESIVSIMTPQKVFQPVKFFKLSKVLLDLN